VLPVLLLPLLDPPVLRVVLDHLELKDQPVHKVHKVLKVLPERRVKLVQQVLLELLQQ
jgi:hypothetical protein